ncbi:zf-HC2 domain-containing protein [uncultured Nitrospira sp.]|uniref:zf-HC2 domain-containing protein n=1 Tax=uncultured Nitrospira sp. TaxID=157176 RepID=UPI0031408004
MGPEQPIHSEATLLPGYVSRTLTPEERQEVDLHLESCASCQQELQETKIIHAALKTAIAKRPGPSPAAFTQVMGRIHQEPQGVSTTVRQGQENSWWESMERTFRSLFEVRWAPALASLLIVGQAVLLVSVLGKPAREIAPGSSPVTERGVPQGTPGIPRIKIQVTFVETAQEIQIRRLVQGLGGQIISGPTPEGLYTLGFAPKGNDSDESILSALHTHPDLINTATALHP